MIVAAKDRFTITGCHRRRGWSYGISASKVYSGRWIVYVCPTCGGEIGLEWPDFAKHAYGTFSNLMYPDRQAIDREARSRLTDENSFIDFYCDACKVAVRAYYIYSSHERACDEFEIKIVVEQKSLAHKPS